MKGCINSNLINSVLCCINPRMNVTPSHYICGSNLALFTSLTQIENCLTGFTTNCKNLTHTLSLNSQKNV